MTKDDIENKIDRLADRLDEKFEKINDRLGNIEIATVQNTASLSEHMLRTEIAEQRLQLIEDEIKPVLQGMSFLKIAGKIGAGIITLWYSIVKFFD